MNTNTINRIKQLDEPDWLKKQLANESLKLDNQNRIDNAIWLGHDLNSKINRVVGQTGNHSDSMEKLQGAR